MAVFTLGAWAWYPSAIDHFTVACQVTWPLNGSEAGGDLAFILIQTPLLYYVHAN